MEHLFQSLAHLFVIAKDFQSYHDKISTYFDEQKIAEIAAIVINMNLWTRLKLAQGATPKIKETK